MPIKYANGNKYIMYFINEYTRMCWVYLLKDKSQDFENFNNFHVWIRNKEQTNISILHYDNGGEYKTNELENYLCQHGI